MKIQRGPATVIRDVFSPCESLIYVAYVRTKLGRPGKTVDLKVRRPASISVLAIFERKIWRIIMSFCYTPSLSECGFFLLPKNHGGQLEDLAEQYNVAPNKIIDFSVNVNPLGLPDSLVKILQENIAFLSRYPDPESRFLCRKLAHTLGLLPEQILVGNGCSELIYLLGRFFQPVNTLIVQPTFSEYEHSILIAGGHVKHYLLSPETDFQCRLDPLIQEASKMQMLFLCNPNNPTGHLMSGYDIIKLAVALPQSLVIVDESFLDFVEDADSYSVIKKASLYPNLIVLRSMTKIFAIPGLRLGYLVANSDLVKHLNRVKEPWTVNYLAQIAGEHLIDLDDYIRRTRDLIRAEKTFLFNELSQFKWLSPYPTDANFFLVQIKHSDITAGILNEKLIHQGIYVRDCSNFVGLNGQFFRIAIKKHLENEKLIASLQEIGEY